MKVIISTGGKFHAFQLARQLDKVGRLKFIITGYPLFRLKNENIDKSKIKSFGIPLLIRYILEKSEFIRSSFPIDYIYKNIYDFLSSRKIRECDIFVGWSGNCTKSIEKAKNIGAITIVERGSAHIEYQNNILIDEYKKYGIKRKPIDKRVIKRELKEYELADYIMVPSNFARDTFIDYGIDKNKVLVCNYGVNIRTFKKIAKNDDIFRVIYVGAISFQKGIQYLLQAVSELNLDKFELMLIGSIENDKMKKMVENCQRCKYIGKKEHNELFKYYSMGSVFVQPSIQEGLSMVIIEAMSCGLPIIATENTGASDIIKDGVNGFVIPIRSSNYIKERIQFLYNNKEIIESMGNNSIEMARKFTWDRYGDEINNIYTNIYMNSKGNV